MPRHVWFPTRRRYERFRGAPATDGISTFEVAGAGPLLLQESVGFTIFTWLKLTDDVQVTTPDFIQLLQDSTFKIKLSPSRSVNSLRVLVNMSDGLGVSTFDNAAGGVIPQNEWVFLAGSLRPGGKMNLWRNEERFTFHASVSGDLSVTTFRARGGPGFQRDVGICVPFLTDAEILALQSSQDVRQTPKLTRYWSLHNPNEPILRPGGDPTLPSDLREYVGGVDHLGVSGSLSAWDTSEGPYA